MARIVVVAGTDAGYKVADVLGAAGHEVARAQAVAESAGADVMFVECWLFATGTPPADVPVVVLASTDALAAAVDAVQQGGAYDLLRVPSTADEMRLVAQRAVRHQQLVRENAALRREIEPLRRQTADRAEPVTAAAGGADEIEQDEAAVVDTAALGSGGGDSDVAAVARNLAGKPLADIEKQVILRTLEQFKGHRLRTAAALGIGVRTLGMKIKRWREEGESIAGRQPRPSVHVDIS